MSRKTTANTISNEQIIALESEAHQARDWGTVDICNQAFVFCSRPALQACCDAINSAIDAEPAS